VSAARVFGRARLVRVHTRPRSVPHALARCARVHATRRRPTRPITGQRRRGPWFGLLGRGQQQGGSDGGAGSSGITSSSSQAAAGGGGGGGGGASSGSKAAERSPMLSLFGRSDEGEGGGRGGLLSSLVKNK
jgi:hypothetical protein